MRLRSANAKVRAERGGEEAARARTDALKAAWPSVVVKHCDSLLAAPMPDTTYEALLAISAWRADRPIPLHLRGPRQGRPRGEPHGNIYIERRRARERARSAARSRAFIRLKALHPEEYRQLYQEERRNEAASTKETA